MNVFVRSFHTYFSVKALPEVSVEGLQGLKMLDRMAKPPAEGKCAGPVGINGAVDSVYYAAPADITLKVGGGAKASRPPLPLPLVPSHSLFNPLNAP